MRSVLLVETEPTLARRIEWILEVEGYGTTIVGSPAAAMRALDDSDYDVIILNSDTAQSTKRAVIGRIRAATSSAVIDVHSAAHPLEAEPDSSGADGIVHMPFDADVLLEQLQRLRAA